MKELFKNFDKKDKFYILLCIILVVFQVYIELKMPEYMSEITRLVQTDESTMKEILLSGAGMLACSLGVLVTMIIVGYLSSSLSASFSKKVRRKVFAKVEEFGIAEIKKFKTSSLITRTTNDITQLESLISMGLQMMMKAPIMAVWAILKIVGTSLEWSIFTAISVVIMLITNVIIMACVIPKFEKLQKLTDKINGVTRENLTGIRVIRAFNAEKFEKKRFNDVNEELTNTQLFNQRVFALMNPMMNFVMHFQQLGIYTMGAFLIAAAGMVDKVNLFSDMVVFSSYGMQVIMSFMMLIAIFMIYPRAKVSAERINEVLDSEISIIGGNFDSETKVKGIIEFKNVSFKYPDADEYILRNISFKVEQGETIAFIGSTGSGKSTLINLVPRLYDATEGEVLVDGINVKEYKTETLNNKIGYIPQQAVMFTGTVSSNVSYGDNGKKKPSKEKIKQAIKIAQGTDFVEKLEDTYDAHIARGGTNISGGQKQRLAIARAIARDPEIYIFDDSFSALDYQTDAKLRKELKKYTKDATSMIVAQRIGTIINADKIIVLDKGKCVGIGTHKELLKTCSVYKEIALSQLSEEELNNG